MRKWKEEALLSYKEECFKQTMPYQYEIAYLDEGGKLEGNPPTSASGTIMYFPDENDNILNFEGINTDYIVFVNKAGVAEKNFVSRLLSAANGADIVYCDEDFINDINADIEDINVRIRNLRTPWRKPEYSPDTLLNFPYIETCFAIRTIFARNVPVLKRTPEISDNVRVWDFLLRATERTNRIVHVSDVLYHRDLKHLLDTKLNPSQVPDEEIYKALEQCYNKPEYLLCKEAAAKRRGLFNLPEVTGDEPLVSIIIPSKDQPKLLKECIRRIRYNSGNIPYEIIVVDNGSTEDAKAEIEKYIDELPNKIGRYIYNEFDFNFSKMCNIGAMEAKAPYLLFLNDDIEATQERFLERMLEYASMMHVGAVGVKLLYPETGCIQHAGVTDIDRGPTHKLITLSDEQIHYYGRNRYVWNVLAVTAACLMVDREKYFQVGGFSDKMKVGYNDVDLCLKLFESGYFNVVINEFSLIHHESVSRGSDAASDAKSERLNEERKLLYDAHKWLSKHEDPFYNKWLDVDTIEIKSKVVADYQKTDFRNKAKMLPKFPGRVSEHVQFSIDRCGIERAIDASVEDAYVFDGWALNDKKDNAFIKKYMILVPIDDEGNDGKECIVTTVSSKYRSDIKEVFPDVPNSLLSGFECRIPVTKLEEGRRYRLGVCTKGMGKFEKYKLKLGNIYEPGRGIITEN